MALAPENDFGRRLTEKLGLDPSTVLGIDIRIEPGNLVIATAKIFVRKDQIEGIAPVFDEMRFVGVKKEPAGRRP